MGLTSKAKTHFFIGTGGVGKTTLASVYAMKLSKENPKAKIKLVTIDPSNRLKTFFKITGEDTTAEVDNLSVHLNDRSKLLKDFVSNAAKKQNIDSEIIFANKLFSTLMGGLAISQEFSSLYELTMSHADKDVDYLVIDTPPLQNASDFLSSSEILEEFFSSSLAKFFLSQDERGFLYKVVNSARRTSLKVLASLTGSSFVDELSFFFKVIEFLREDLLSVLKESKVILSEEAEIYIVCNANELSLCGVNVALHNISHDGLNLKKCIVNKFDAENLGKVSIEKIKKIKRDFPKLSYAQVKRFAKEPSAYEDLIKRVEDVKL